MSNNPYETPRAASERSSSGSSNLGRFILWHLLSLFVMIPWPLLGMWLSTQLQAIETSSEYYFMFGGITIFFWIPFAIMGFELSDETLGYILVAVWVLFWTVPVLLFARKHLKKTGAILLLVSQSTFSLGQALMGVMLLIGKSV